MDFEKHVPQHCFQSARHDPGLSFSAAGHRLALPSVQGVIYLFIYFSLWAWPFHFFCMIALFFSALSRDTPTYLYAGVWVTRNYSTTFCSILLISWKTLLSYAVTNGLFSNCSKPRSPTEVYLTQCECSSSSTWHKISLCLTYLFQLVFTNTVHHKWASETQLQGLAVRL